jgi:hypothetical protein
MRIPALLLCLTSLSAFAQLGAPLRAVGAPNLAWTLGVQKVQPTLSATVSGTRDGRTSLVDTDADLGLSREKSPLGFFGEYSGASSMLLLSYDATEYGGSRAQTRAIALDGHGYVAGTTVVSSAKVRVLDGVWTYKFIARSDAWIGLDLAGQYLMADLSARDATASLTQQASPSLLLPQVGLSAWSNGVDGLVETRVYYRLMKLKGASTTRYGLDARAYFYPNFGVRFFYDSSKIRIPAGSLQQDLDIAADRKSTGFGLVLRF